MEHIAVYCSEQWPWYSGGTCDWMHSAISKKKHYYPRQLILELASCCAAGIWQKSTKYVGLVYNILGFTEDSFCGREITECAMLSGVYIKANLSQREWTLSFMAFTCITPVIWMKTLCQ